MGKLVRIADYVSRQNRTTSTAERYAADLARTKSRTLEIISSEVRRIVCSKTISIDDVEGLIEEITTIYPDFSQETLQEVVEKTTNELAKEGWIPQSIWNPAFECVRKIALKNPDWEKRRGEIHKLLRHRYRYRGAGLNINAINRLLRAVKRNLANRGFVAEKQ